MKSMSIRLAIKMLSAQKKSRAFAQAILEEMHEVSKKSSEHLNNEVETLKINVRAFLSVQFSVFSYRALMSVV